jgi:glycosyltransferase involved in cell wall biosynthesis
VIKVGLILSLRGMWQGGQNYYHNLLRCFQRNCDATIKLEVFTDHDEDVARYQCSAIDIHRSSMVAQGQLWNWPRRRLNGLVGYDPLLLNLMARHGITILTHRSLGKQRRINTLPWLPDLQHKRFPQFFDVRDRANRDSSIVNALLWGNILLSSHAAAKDLRRYFPELDTVQTRVLHFSSATVLDVLPLPMEQLGAHYPIEKPYFFLPNQFWRHKNHAVVVDALCQTPRNIRVVCTGLMRDTRCAAYVPALLDKVRQAGVGNRFVCLGTVPYRVMASLMYHSLAVLQPSLFEGWSTSVEESKAMGKRIILSRIDVHLEQAPERGTYFSPDSPEELAACMNDMYTTSDPAAEQLFVERREHYRAERERDWIKNYRFILKAVSAPYGL